MTGLLTIENKTDHVFELREASQIVPEGTVTVDVYCKVETLDLPTSVRFLNVRDGGRVGIVPGVRNVRVCFQGSVDRFSNGTVEIDDMRDGAIGREAFEGVETLQIYWSECLNPDLVWLPPTVVSANVNHVDKDSLAACANLRMLTLGHLDGHILPPSLEDLVVVNYRSGFIPASVRVLDLKHSHGKETVRGDFSNLRSLEINDDLWRKMKTPMPALRVLQVDSNGQNDISDLVFPEGIVELTLRKGRGKPNLPRSLKELHLVDFVFRD